MPTTIEGTNGIDQIDPAAQSNNLPVFQVRAWVSFDGADGSINASGNVASVTRNGTGDYTIAFNTPMPDGNYAVCGWAKDSGSGGSITFIGAYANGLKSTTQLQIRAEEGSGAPDPPEVTVMVVR